MKGIQRYLVAALVLALCSGCNFYAMPVVTETFTVASSTPPDSPSAVETQSLLTDDICYGEEGTDGTVVSAVNRQLLLVPRWLREAFVQSGWSMSVVGYDIATEDYPGEFEAGTVFGSTSYSNRHIKILNTIRAASNSPIHEMGHWLDCYTQYPTLNDEDYQRIFEEENGAYRNSFGPECSWGPQEFFAEGFWCYWRSPGLLRRTCPKFYSFMENTLLVAQSNYKSVNSVKYG